MKQHLSPLLFAFCWCLLTSAGWAQQKVSAPYTATGLSANGQTIWIAGATNERGEGIYKYVNGNWYYYAGMTGTEVFATPDNRVVVKKANGQLFEWKNNQWQPVNGSAVDLAVSGGSGTLWKTDGSKILRYANGAWQNHTTNTIAATRVAADINDRLYTVNNSGYCFEQNGSSWKLMTNRQARDLDVGNDGTIWMISTEHAGPGYKIYRWNNQNWMPQSGSATQLAAGAQGVLWTLNSKGELHRLSGANWVRMTLQPLNNNTNGGSGNHENTVYDSPYDANASVTKKYPDGSTQLNYAVQSGDPTNVYTVLGKGANIHNINNAGRTALYDALHIRRADLAGILLTSGINPNTVDTAGLTPLALAVRSNDVESATALLQNRAKVGNHLMTAVQQNNTAMAGVLFENGARVTNKEPLNLAIKKNNADLATLIVLNGGDPNVGLDFGLRNDYRGLINASLDRGAPVAKVLPHAVRTDNGALLEKALVQHKANPNEALKLAVTAKNNPLTEIALKHGGQPDVVLPIAAKNGDLEGVHLLLANGAHADAGMQGALEGNHTETISLLLEKGAQATPIQYIKTAAGKGNAQVVQMLLDRGAEVNPGLQPAIDKNHTAVAELLLNAGAEATAAPLITGAAKQGNNQIVQMLLDRGADANNGVKAAINAKKSKTAILLLDNGADASNPKYIEMASYQGDLPLVESLIKYGATPDNGMEKAVHQGKVAVLNKLIESGADPKKDAYVVAAVKQKRKNALFVLLKNEAPVTYKSSNGETLLHLAAKTLSRPILVALLDAGLDIEAKNNGGNTALHIVVDTGKNNIDLTKLLIDRGANINAVNGDGKTPLMIANGLKLRKFIKKQGGRKYK